MEKMKDFLGISGNLVAFKEGAGWLEKWMLIRV